MRNIGEIFWVALAIVPFKPFIDGIVAKIGEDSWVALKKSFRSISARDIKNSTGSKKTPRVFLLQDSDSGVRVVIDPELPVEALRRLPEIETEQNSNGIMKYNAESGRWENVL